MGTVVSVLVTPNEQEEKLPLPSPTVNTTVVVPNPVTVVPEAGDCVTLGVPQLSAVDAAL